MRTSSLLLSLLAIILMVWGTFYSSMPGDISVKENTLKEFSTRRALTHVKQISRTQHYVGSDAHETVKKYIIDVLLGMGLSVEIQKGFSISKTGSCASIENIITKIKGSDTATKHKKALLLLSHYDSATHSSFGASDDASGVATILEGIRAFLAKNLNPKNDIIICITDGEELGLLGANYFVNHHRYAKDIGLVLNFEARGSGGESFMLVETNSKNSSLIQHFAAAKTPFPVANSLAYSVYKMIPNDTDLTVFREQMDIPGFNFAFIDDHFDYHTARDTWDNLDPKTLAHQGSYLMALLPYFTNISLENFNSEQDDIYFDIPFAGIVYYPFNWMFPILGIAFLLFMLLIFYGKAFGYMQAKEILKGFAAILLAILISGAIGFFGWKLLEILYPQYSEILQGFPYNGHYYIFAFIMISIGISFNCYHRFTKNDNYPSLFISVLAIWFLLCFFSALYVPGASYLALLLFPALLQLWILIRWKKPNVFLMLLASFPAIYIITPFIIRFPVALGLRIVFLSCILTTLLFALILPISAQFFQKRILSLLFFFVAVIFIGIAHFNSESSEEQPKPNSLVYILDTDQETGAWATYDQLLDSWTKNYINPENNLATDYNKNTLDNKYNLQFAYVTDAPIKELKTPIFEVYRDTVIQNSRELYLCITPQRIVNRMDLYTNTLFNFEEFEVNGQSAKDFTYKNLGRYNAFKKRWNKNLLTYYVTKNHPLELSMRFHKDSLPEFTLYESSYDLLTNPLFSVPDRPEEMMTKPFILNDAVVLKTKFIPDSTKIGSMRKHNFSMEE